MKHLSRRTLLTATAAGAVAFSTPSAALAVSLSGSPDAELVQAFEDWRQASLDLDALPESEDDHPDRLAIWARIDGATDVLVERPALTAEGIVAKLRRVFPALAEDTEAYDAVYEGREPGAEVLADFRYRILWDVIRDVERLGVSRSQGPDLGGMAGFAA